MSDVVTDAAKKFDLARANEYEKQSRIALAGYDACHELIACMLAADLQCVSNPTIMIAGSGTAQEIISIGALGPSWNYVAVDPAPPMMELAEKRLSAAGLRERVTLHLGYVSDLPIDVKYDAATLIGVLHHLRGDSTKREMLASIASRLKPGAPFVLACNHYAYANEPQLLSAWRQRWRMHGATADEIEAKLGKIMQGADPLRSEEEVASMLSDCGFNTPKRFFSSLFWGAWVATRK